jgi:hypothetical protein
MVSPSKILERFIVTMACVSLWAVPRAVAAQDRNASAALYVTAVRAVQAKSPKIPYLLVAETNRDTSIIRTAGAHLRIPFENVALAPNRKAANDTTTLSVRLDSISEANAVARVTTRGWYFPKSAVGKPVAWFAIYRVSMVRRNGRWSVESISTEMES